MALTEALVAVAVVALMGGLAFSTFGGNDRRLVTVEAARVALHIAEARLMAAEAGQAVALTWSPSDRTLDAGGRTLSLRRGVAGPSVPFALSILPNGESEGLSLPLEAGQHGRTVTLGWLDGRVEVRR